MRSYKKYIKRYLVTLLVLSFVCASTIHVFATEETESEEDSVEDSGEERSQETQKEKSEEEKKNEEKLSDLENQRQETLDEIDDLKDSISSVQKEIDGLQSEKSTIQSYINKLDQQMDQLTRKITSFEGKIEEKIGDIEETKEALETAKKECDKQYELMKKRIQFIYENPTASIIEVLCSAKDMTDFLNRADQVASMSDYDREMMDKLEATKAAIEEKEKTLKAELEELEMMQAELESQKKKVNTSINAKKGELSAKAEELGNASSEQGDYQKQLEEQEKLLNEIEEQIAKAANPGAYDGETTGFIWPCPGYTRISSYFGPRPQPVPGASTYHKGVDLAAPYGSDILASASGVVTTSRYSASAGNYIVIAHGNGMSTVYMHASSLLVSVGETVSQGQVIAKVGSTGYSSGNHLHFGVIKNGSYVDPLGYI